jgi:hypothetical protein
MSTKSIINLNFRYYFYSILTILFQFLFLAFLKDFEHFNKYIEIFSLSIIVIGIFGSIQFYFIKEKNQLIGIRINKNVRIFFPLIVSIAFIYYLYHDLRFGLFFLSAIILSSIVLYQGAVYANMNHSFYNSKFTLIVSSFKFFLLLILTLFSNNIFVILICSNLIIIFIWVFFYYKSTLFEENGYSIFSATNTMIGGSITSIDKIIVSNLYQNLSINYYLIFRVSSILQVISEIVFRNERFQITSKTKKIKFKNVIFKILLLIFFIFLSSHLLKFSYYVTYLFKVEFINDFFMIVSKYYYEYILITSAILINSISGLFYDNIYSYYGNKNLIFINLFTFILFTVFLFNFVSNLTSICLIFLLIQSITLVLLILLNLIRKKNEGKFYTKKP